MSAFDQEKWGVHICGPDSIKAAKSFEEAVKKCNEINQHILALIERGAFNSEFDPLTWAKVDRWEEIGGDCEHNPDSEDWDEVC